MRNDFSVRENMDIKFENCFAAYSPATWFNPSVYASSPSTSKFQKDNQSS